VMDAALPLPPGMIVSGDPIRLPYTLVSWLGSWVLRLPPGMIVSGDPIRLPYTLVSWLGSWVHVKVVDAVIARSVASPDAAGSWVGPGAGRGWGTGSASMSSCPRPCRGDSGLGGWWPKADGARPCCVGVGVALLRRYLIIK
jgi:hypothetical protein